MEKKLKLILIIAIATLVFQVAFALVLINSFKPITNGSGEVKSMSREERLNLLETLWQAEDFKNADEETRRKAFESIVIE